MNWLKYFILLLPPLCSSLSILVTMTHQGKSHFMAFEPLFKVLAQRGHNVTVISYFPQKEKIPNYRDISLQNSSYVVQGTGILEMDQMPSSKKVTSYIGPLVLAYFAWQDCVTNLGNNEFQKFLQEDNKFDVVLSEVFNTNCFMGLAKRFKAPVIGLSSCSQMPWTYDYLGNPQNPSYIPNLFLDISDNMTFLERVENTVFNFYTRLAYRYLMEIPGNKLSKEYIGEDLLDGDEFLYNNMSLVLTNSHFSLNLPKPFVPGYVEVGGLNVGKPKKLPSNIEKWINDSPEGVIYVSFGSMIKGHTFPEEKRQAFLNAFKRLPQRVLWKWENDSMVGQPKNVMIQKWMPQLDIHCHPNVKAFISHGGLLGTMEAVHCGVPIVVVPQFGDQYANARAVEASGGGVILQLKEATEDKLYEALKKVLSPDFRQKAKELSERFRDRPLPPLETAIYWVEYVARHKGAPHMRTAAVNMPFYKYYLLDVAAFLLIVFTLYVYVFYRLLKLVLKKVFKRKEEKIKSS